MSYRHCPNLLELAISCPQGICLWNFLPPVSNVPWSSSETCAACAAGTHPAVTLVPTSPLFLQLHLSLQGFPKSGKRLLPRISALPPASVNCTLGESQLLRSPKEPWLPRCISPEVSQRRFE